MTDFLLQFGISNLCISLALAIVAWAVHTTGKRPLLAHLLWLLVLAKLVTPPIVTVPLVPVPGLTANTLADHSGPEATTPSMLIPDLDGSSATFDRGADETSWGVATAWFVAYGKTGLVLFWVFGSACVLAWSLVRIYRFHRLLKMASEVAPPDLQCLASEIAQRLGLRETPTICTTSARLSPMVWWLGGRVRIVIPAALPDEMDAGQLRWILAHELAHVRRRDHLVRWLEWLACVCFWWNPVAWWARRNLRINEEICCGALVLSSFEPKPRTYANALMTLVEFLASPVIRPPAMASEINSGGFLERRFRMIVSNNPIPKTPRWLVAGVLLTALTLLPLGVAYAQDRDCDKGERDDAMKRRIAGALAEAGIEREVIRDVMGAMRRIMEELRTEGDAFELDPKMQDHLEGLGLTGEQIEFVVGLSRRVMAAHEDSRRGRDDAIWRRVAGALGEAGIEREIIRDVLGAMRRIVVGVQSKGNAFELDPRMQAHLEELGLTDEQIDLVVGLSKRVAASPAVRGDSRADAIWRRVAGALHEGGIERLKIRDVMGAMKRIVHEMKAEGEDFELDPRLREYLVNRLELTDEQIELVVGLSRRVAAARGDDDLRGRLMRALMEQGIERDQVRGVMGLLRVIVGEIQREGDEFELDPGVRERLEGLGLTGEQIDFVVRLG